jgi:hypothetical protein
MTPQKQKTYRVDSLRNEDRNQINTIIKKLLRNRVDEKLNIKKLEKKVISFFFCLCYVFDLLNFDL